MVFSLTSALSEIREIIIMALAVIIPTSIGIALYRRGKHLLKYGKTSKGKVVDLKKKHNGSNYRSYYHLAILFKTEEGQEIRKELIFGYNQSKYKIGDEIDIIYDPQYPTRCRRNSRTRLVRFPLMLLTLGLIIFVVSMFLYFSNT